MSTAEVIEKNVIINSVEILPPTKKKYSMIIYEENYEPVEIRLIDKLTDEIVNKNITLIADTGKKIVKAASDKQRKRFQWADRPEKLKQTIGKTWLAIRTPFIFAFVFIMLIIRE